MSYRFEGGELRYEGSPAYRLASGAVQEVEIPAGGLEVATSRRDLARPLHLLTGHEDTGWRSFSLPAVAEVAQRLTPWATWWAAPRYTGSADEAGRAWWRSGVAVLRSTLDPWNAVAVAHHEAWHLADDHLTLEERQTMDAAIARGPAWPTNYLADPWERRARLFASWAMTIYEGGSARLDRRAPELDVMSRVYSGDLGRRVLARQIGATGGAMLGAKLAPLWRYVRSSLGASSTTTTTSPGSPSLT